VHLLAERADLVDEAREKLVEAFVEYLIHLGLGELREKPAGGPLRGRAPVVATREAFEMAVHPLDAGDQGAGALRVEDQEMRDPRRRHLAAIGPVEGPVRRHRAQERHPLVVVEAGADEVHLRQQDVVFHVEQARGVVGALQMVAEMQEIVVVVPELGGVDGAAHEGGGAGGPVGELAHRQLAAGRAFQFAQFLIGVVERVPDLRGERGADDPAVLAGVAQAGGDRGRVVVVEEEMAFDVALDRLAVLVGEGVRGAGGAQERVPFVAVAVAGIGDQRDAGADFEEAGGGLGALHVAGEPVEVGGGAAQHGAAGMGKRAVRAGAHPVKLLM